jgi:hypothetical protein
MGYFPSKIDPDHSSSFPGALLVLTRQFEDLSSSVHREQRDDVLENPNRARLGFSAASLQVSKGHLKYKNPFASCSPQTKRNIYYIL